MPVSCHFQGCKALLRTGKQRYIKYRAFAFAFLAFCRRPGEEGEIKDRKAFRLCIRADDRDLLLDASKWPNSIAVSEWFFITPQVQNDKRRRLLEPDDSTSAAGNTTDGAAGAIDMFF